MAQPAPRQKRRAWWYFLWFVIAVAVASELMTWLKLIPWQK